MPIYEYSCSYCRKNFEEWLKADDQAKTHPCPECGRPAPRIVSHTSFMLKGGGWYVSEYGYKKNEHEGGTPSHTAEKDAPASAETTAADAAAPAPGPAPAAASAAEAKAPAIAPKAPVTPPSAPSTGASAQAST